MKYYILYDYKSVLEAIACNFSHLSMINTTSIIAINNFSISVIKRICIRSFTRRWKFMPYHFDASTLLATVDSPDSTEYHFIINLKDRLINDITYVRNSAISTKYGTVDEVELCLKILSTNCLCSTSLTFNFFIYWTPAKKSTHYKKINIIIIILFWI